MTIRQYINALEILLKEHGDDIPVYLIDGDYNQVLEEVRVPEFCHAGEYLADEDCIVI